MWGRMCRVLGTHLLGGICAILLFECGKVQESYTIFFCISSDSRILSFPWNHIREMNVSDIHPPLVKLQSIMHTQYLTDLREP
jgi:hypothetical protein